MNNYTARAKIKVLNVNELNIFQQRSIGIFYKKF